MKKQSYIIPCAILSALISGCSTIDYPETTSASLTQYYKCSKGDQTYAYKQDYIIAPSENEISNGIIADGFQVKNCHKISVNKYKALLKNSKEQH